MAGITTSRPIKRELATAGYSLARAGDFQMTDALRQDWLNLQIDYADLISDDYLPGGGKYRFRRYGRFRYTPGSGALTPLPHEGYFQSADFNRVTGVARKFAPLLDTTFDNACLRALIRFDFNQLPLDGTLLKDDWEVRVHLIRVVAREGEPGQPTPEGIHRDGARFVTVRLAERVNAAGGEVTIYAANQQPLTSFRLEQALDCYFIDDARLWHAAEPIQPRDPAHRALRSVLTFDFRFPAGAASRAE